MDVAELSAADKKRLAEIQKERLDYFVSLGRMNTGVAKEKARVVALKMLAAEKEEQANESAPVAETPPPAPAKTQGRGRGTRSSH